MPIWKLATQVWYDSLLPRDAMMINPVFRDRGVGTDPTQLCTDLLNQIKAKFVQISPNQMRCRAYDVEGSAPVYPAADVTLNPNGVSTAAVPREMALCLSFYAQYNRPRTRGRLYIPLCWFSSSGPGARPTSTHRTGVGAFVTSLEGLGGIDVDWGVWSKADSTFRKATNWFVDDEWDIQRRRGSKPTTRTTGTTSG